MGWCLFDVVVYALNMLLRESEEGRETAALISLISERQKKTKTKKKKTPKKKQRKKPVLMC
jgi:hypothetical protein